MNPDINLNLGTVSGSISVAPVKPNTLISMTLAGNVTAHTFTGTELNPGSIVVYKIVQNDTGGFTFAWPDCAIGVASVGPDANQVTYQSFFWSGTNLIAMGPGVVFP